MVEIGSEMTQIDFSNSGYWIRDINEIKARGTQKRSSEELPATLSWELV